MLRFRDNQIAAKPHVRRISRRERVRLWLLVLALGLVLIVMKRMQQPQTVQKMDQLFGIQESQLVDTRVDRAIDEKLLDEIEDNTSFRPKEQAAWFAMFKRLEQLATDELRDQSMGTLSYAQLLQQPEIYRGRIVTLRGTVVREEIQHAPKNSLGIETYHRLWLQPAGGGQWPFVVYCLQLPEQFPRGDSLHAPVAVNGYFFKNWSYSWDDGFGLAPIVLAAEFAWSRPLPAQEKLTAPVRWKALALGVVAAALFAMAVLYFSWKQTRNQPRKTARSSEDTTIREAMRRLSESELDA